MAGDRQELRGELLREMRQSERADGEGFDFHSVEISIGRLIDLIGSMLTACSWFLPQRVPGDKDSASTARAQMTRHKGRGCTQEIMLCPDLFERGRPRRLLHSCQASPLTNILTLHLSTRCNSFLRRTTQQEPQSAGNLSKLPELPKFLNF